MFTRLKSVFRRYFITGFFILIPLFMSIFVMVFVVNKFDELLIPEFVARIIGFRIPGLGIIVMLIATLVTGAFARNFLGRKFIEWSERIMGSIPLGGTIYHGTKQLLNAVRLKDQGAFRRVVLIEYPKKDIYSLAFVTGNAADSFQRKLNRKLINVFVPTTPNPTSGFFLIVPEDEALEMDLTVPEAFRLVVSAGIVKGQRNGKSEPGSVVVG